MVGTGEKHADATTTAEVTGVGPAVRESVTSSGPSNTDPTVAAISGTQEAEAEAGLEASATPNPNAAVVEDAPDGIPENLVTQVHLNGSFSLQGVLVSATDTEITALPRSTTSGTSSTSAVR